LAASAAFHLFVFLLLGLALRYNPVFPVAPVLEVRLVTLSPTHVEAKPPPPRATPNPAAAPSPAPPLAPHIPLATAPPAPPTVAPAPVLPPAQPGAEALRRGMRLMLGCAHPDDFDLSPSEREACRQMTAQTQAAAPTYGALSEHTRRQVPRDDAERAYRDSTSMDDYPGVHCLANEECTPDAPTPPAEPGHDDCPWAWCHMVGR
jgi:type IV secretory pathway VirB10-like protein